MFFSKYSALSCSSKARSSSRFFVFFSFSFLIEREGECETESLEDEGFKHKGIVLGWSFPLCVFTIKEDIFAR